MILDEESLDWKFPIEYPKDDKKYYWDESSFVWLEII
jgi:hypothetical protein